jgi:hypothetical protein
MRIAALLNKELKLNMENQFVGQNANNASPADVKSFTEGYLSVRTATATEDNLILWSGNVTVSLSGTDMQVQYAFRPNGPVNRIFITGVMLNVEASA